MKGADTNHQTRRQEATEEAKRSLYYAAACQTAFPCPTTRDEIGSRTQAMCQMVERTVVGYEPFFDVRLFVFPEYAHGAAVYDTVEEIREQVAIEVPNEHTEQLTRTARQYGCYIQSGTFLEFDSAYPDVVFNTTVLIGPDGVLSKYRKVNPWIPWEVHASPDDFDDYDDEIFPVVDTEIGRLGVAICYDWTFPETIRQICVKGAEVVLRVSAYMDPWGATPPLDWWTLFNRTRAIENMVYVVAANQGALPEGLPPFTWPGASMVVDYEGRIQAQADPGPGEKVVVGPIDIDRLRRERQRRLGHDMRAHLRPGVHDYCQKTYLPPANHPITVEGLRERIRQSKSSLP